jgi:hypothetical protein
MLATPHPGRIGLEDGPDRAQVQCSPPSPTLPSVVARGALPAPAAPPPVRFRGRTCATSSCSSSSNSIASMTAFSTPNRARHRVAFCTPFSALQFRTSTSQEPRQGTACARSGALNHPRKHQESRENTITVVHERPPFAMGHQARQAHQEDVPNARPKTLNVFLCRDGCAELPMSGRHPSVGQYCFGEMGACMPLGIQHWPESAATRALQECVSPPRTPRADRPDLPMSGRTQPRREPRSVTMRLMGMSPARLLLPVLLLTASWALVACGSSPAESTNSAMSASTTPTPSNASGPAEPGRTESKNGQGRLDALSISLTLRSTRVQQGRTLRSRALIENNTSEPALLTLPYQSVSRSPGWRAKLGPVALGHPPCVLLDSCP